MTDRTPLQSSVITSSSRLPLKQLLVEAQKIDDLRLFDLTILRDIDIQSLYATSIEVSCNPASLPSATDVLSFSGSCSWIIEWIKEQITSANIDPTMIRFAALASYFPGITTLDVRRRDESVNALANTILIALMLEDLGLMTYPIVKAVCGTVVDMCRCQGCQNAVAAAERSLSHRENECRIFIYDREDKVKLLCESLERVIRVVKTECNGKYASRPFAIALETEPGATYVLNSTSAIKLFKRHLGQRAFKTLRPHVGLNIDIAHMIIAGISASDLRPYRNLFVHAHIADNPGMHTRDQVVGTWTPVDCYDGAYYPFIELLMERVEAEGSKRRLPFSGTVALELEGCSRMSWIHASLVAMRHLTYAASMRYHNLT